MTVKHKWAQNIMRLYVIERKAKFIYEAEIISGMEHGTWNNGPDGFLT
jgi:hypothetical protein